MIAPVAVAGGVGRLTEHPAGLWEHIAQRLPLGRNDAARQAGLVWLLATAAGRPDPERLVALGLQVLGWVGRDSRQPLNARDGSVAVHDTRVVFDRLGLLGRQRWAQPAEPLPAAAGQLARAALPGNDQVAVPLEDRGAGAEPATGAALELTVTLQGVQPPVWRRLVVPESLTLRQFHAVLQTAMGWEDAHLDLFEVDDVRYGDVEDLSSELGDEETFTIGDAAAVTAEFSYGYNSGDAWEHRIRVRQRLPSVGPGTRRCLAGARACPPENCG